MQNPFIWHDLMTSDVEGAKKFYGAVVGWTFQSQMPEYDVANIKSGGSMGGIMPMSDTMKGIPPFWSGYIYVTDVDATCAKIKKLGGGVKREPWDVPDVGCIAVVADPTGARFNIMAPIPREGSNLPASSALGAVGWNEAHVGDLDTAWNFYAEMFGWTKGTVMPMGAMGDYMLFQIDGKDTGGMMKKQDMLPMPMWLYYFNVDGIDAAVARITKAGGRIAMGPHQVPGGQWIVSAFDPQGGSFQLLSATK